MRVQVNGVERETAAATVGDLLREMGIDSAKRGSAVAINDSVAPRAAWDDTALHENDRVEVIRPVQGG